MTNVVCGLPKKVNKNALICCIGGSFYCLSNIRVIKFCFRPNILL